MTAYPMFLEVFREDGTIARVSAAAIEAITEAKDKKTGETRATIVIRANAIRVADLSYDEVWALFVEAAGYNVHVMRSPKPHLLTRDIEPGI